MIEGRERRIVVGIDGSTESLAALRWALREAAATDSSVEVVHCWHPHAVTDVLFGSPEELHRGSVCMLRNEVTAALAEMSGRKPDVLESSRRGRPGPVLLERTTVARLLVLGAHGRTELRDLAHGQVVSTCLKHASCPVVVVGGDESVLHHTGRPLTSSLA